MTDLEQRRAALASALESGDVDAIAGIARGLTEKQRKELWHEKLAAAKLRSPWSRKAAELAVLAFGSARDVGKVLVVGVEPDAAVAILAERRPPWLQRHVDSVMTTRFSSFWWPAVRGLARTGLVAEPADDNYNAWLVERRASEESRPSPDGSTAQGERYVRASDGAVIGEDEELLERTWRLFESEGGHSIYHRLSPKVAVDLAARAADGRIDRARLLEACVAAMERDFHPTWAPFYAELHDLLRPTTDELAPRAGRYVTLVGSRTTATATCALEALTRLEKAGTLSSAGLAAHAARGFEAKAKTTRRQLLKILERAARRDPVDAAALARAAAAGLLDADAAVREGALAMVEAHGDRADADLRGVLEQAREIVVPSLRARVDAWLGHATAEPPPPSQVGDDHDVIARARGLDPELARRCGVDLALAALDGALLVQAIPPSPMPLYPTLRRDPPVRPVETLDDLIALLARLLEGQGSGEDIELALDGLARLCDQRPEDFTQRTAPLASRALDVLVDGLGLGVNLCAWPGGAERLQERWEKLRARAERNGDASPEPIDRAVLQSRPPARCGVSVSVDVAQAALAWIHGRDLEAETFGPGVTWPGVARSTWLPMLYVAMSRRALWVAGLAGRRKPAPLLTTPTHAGGWIDPVVWVERVKARIRCGVAMPRLEVVQSLLRLGFERRPEALAMLASIKGELGDAARHGLGAAGITPGPSSMTWIAAARARAPFDDDPTVEARHPGSGPDAGRAARIEAETRRASAPWVMSGSELIRTQDASVLSDSGWRLSLRFDPPCPTDLGTANPSVLVSAVKARDSGPRLVDPWIALAWPQSRESLLARAADACVTWLDARCHAPRTWLEVLLDPSVALRPMAQRALAFALAVKDPAIHGLAADIAIAAVDDGRLDAATLSDVLRVVLAEECVTVSRVVQRLVDVGRASVLHGQVVRGALESVLDLLVRQRPATLLAALELLHDLCVAQGEGIGDAARELLRSVDRGKAGDRARRLLDLRAEEPGVVRRAAAAAALRGRVARALSGPAADAGDGRHVADA